ncbi:MAG: hypothetical protein JSU95_13450 [Betaproteobacteria bacterium]|nr:MAG: hypothetical protein JSU95_13450 [Betaproteobacteria bacterium]
MRFLMLALLAIASVAHAADKDDVHEFFDNLVERTNAFDAGVANLYSPDARIIAVVDGGDIVEISGSQLKQIANQVMPIAKKRGDTNTYKKVKVSPHGEGFRVTGVRFSAAKCVTDPNYHLDVVRHDKSWLVIEEYGETVSLSQCKTSKKLAASLNALRDGIVPHLPLDLDADTRLEAVEVVGPALIYRQRLHTIAAAETDMQKLVPALRQIGYQNACGLQQIKTLINEGATVRYQYIDRNGAKLANVDFAPGFCPS